MNRKRQVALIAIISLVFNIFASGASAIADEYVPKDPGSIYDDLTGDYGLLGIAGQFHVFAREKTTISAHTDGNVATRILDANNDFGTNVHEGLLDQEINYIQSTDSFINSSGVPTGDTRTNKFVVGSTVAVSEAEGHPVVNGSRIDHLTFDDFYQDRAGSTYIDFDAEFAKLNTSSDTLMNMAPTRSYTAADFPDMNNRTIDLTGASDTGFVLVNIDANVLTMNTPLNIINPNDQIVVFNVVNGSSDLAVQSPIRYNDRTNHETEDFSDANISFNFGNNMANLSINAPFQGTILAPNADIHVTQSQDGTIIGTNIILDAATNRWDPNEIFPTPGEETETISGVKTWEDNDNAAQERPNAINIALLQNGNPYQTKIVTADANGAWTYEFSDVPKNDENGNPYVYSIVESTVPTNYRAEIEGYNIKNIYIGDGSVTTDTTTDTTDTTSSTTDTTSSTTDTTSSTTDTTSSTTDTTSSTTDTTSSTTDTTSNTTDTTSSTTDTTSSTTDTTSSTTDTTSSTTDTTSDTTDTTSSTTDTTDTTSSTTDTTSDTTDTTSSTTDTTSSTTDTTSSTTDTTSSTTDTTSSTTDTTSDTTDTTSSTTDTTSSTTDTTSSTTDTTSSTTDTTSSTTDTTSSTTDTTSTDTTSSTTDTTSTSGEPSGSNGDGGTPPGPRKTTGDSETTDTTTSHSGVVYGNNDGGNNGNHLTSSKLGSGSLNKMGKGKLSSLYSDTLGKYLPKTGSESSKWLMASGGILVIAGITGFAWKRKKAKR